MKKILLIFIISPFLITGQNYKLDSITGSNGLLLYSIYDNSGNAIRDYYKFSTIDWKYENTYDANNNKIESIIYENNSGTWNEYQRYTYTYQNNKLQLSETYSWESNAWDLGEKTHYYYDVNDDLEFMEMFNWDNNNWVLNNRTDFSYSNNNQIEYVNSVWDGYSYEYSYKLEREFLNNNIEEEEYFTYQNGSWVSSYTAEYTCNNILMSNTKFGLAFGDFTLFENQVTELEYSWGDTYNYHYSISSFSTNINEIENFENNLYIVTDILGKQVKIGPNQPLFYLYKDGSVKKKMIIK